MATRLDDYRRHAVAHAFFTAEGDADGVNSSYDKLQRAFVSILSEGKGGELFRLYDDLDPNVQCWAAAHTLEIDEKKALAKLRDLEKSSDPHVSMDAEYTIREWTSGALRFLPS